MVRKIATIGHHGRTVVACEPTTSLSEFIEDIERALTQAKEYGNNVRRLEMPKSLYDRIAPEIIAEKEREHNCEIVPIVRKEYKAVVKPEVKTRPQDAMKYYKRGLKHRRR